MKYKSSSKIFGGKTIIQKPIRFFIKIYQNSYRFVSVWVFRCVVLVGLSFVCMGGISEVFGLSKKEKKRLEVYQFLLRELSEMESKEKLQKIFLDSRVRFRSRLIWLNIDPPSQKKYFAESLKKKVIEKGVNFRKKHRKALEKIEKEYGVPAELIVSILYVESNFSLKTARFHVFSAYSTLSFAGRPYWKKQAIKNLNKKYSRLSKKDLETKKKELVERLNRKAKWALEELKALFLASKKMKRPILGLKGSFAGAMGYPQFIPSSYLKYALDGNGDGRVDLYQLEDAMVSVANYLKNHGFKQEDPESYSEAVYSYNHSHEYVDFVLKYFLRVKKAWKKLEKLEKSKK